MLGELQRHVVMRVITASYVTSMRSVYVCEGLNIWNMDKERFIKHMGAKFVAGLQYWKLMVCMEIHYACFGEVDISQHVYIESIDTSIYNWLVVAQKQTTS